MKNKWHDIIRKRLKENRKECLACLYPKEGYEWGACNKKSLGRTLKLINRLLKGIPVEAWTKKPDKNKDFFDNSSHTIASNNWSIKLMWDKNKRQADLRFRNNDHTAWVQERKGRFVNFDIGGS